MKKTILLALLICSLLVSVPYVEAASPDDPFILYFLDLGFDPSTLFASTIATKKVDDKNEYTYPTLDESQYYISTENVHEGLLAVEFYPPFPTEYGDFKAANSSFILTGEIEGKAFDSIAVRDQADFTNLFLYKLSLENLPAGEVSSIGTYYHKGSGLTRLNSLESSRVLESQDDILGRKLIQEVYVVSDHILDFSVWEPQKEDGTRSSVGGIDTLLTGDWKIGATETHKENYFIDRVSHSWDVKITKVSVIRDASTPDVIGGKTEENTDEGVVVDEPQSTNSGENLGIITVQKDGTNVRVSGNSDSEIVGKVNQGEEYEVTDIASSGWFGFVLPNGKTGYISPKMVELKD